ncbi:MAG: phosphodiester glycosidase family protein [Clostridium sp.]|nr:phosphodiester glycosidase family protein [Clostridium sp.]
MHIKKILKLLIKSITALLVLCILFMTLVFHCNFQPFKNLRTLWVTTAMTTFTHQWLATDFISSSEIKRIMNENKVVSTNAKTDTSKIKISSKSESVTNVNADSYKGSDKISVINISENNYVGKLMIVDDPSRIKLGTINRFGSNYRGMKLSALAQKYGAIAAINSSAFQDDGGTGNGGTPMGIVIKNGQVLYRDGQSSYTLVGFDYNNKLITGQYTLADIKKSNIKDAVSFGPALIVNGSAIKIYGDGGSGLQPRTAIGQTADGKVLLLEIDGRQPLYSVGASMKDVLNILVKYGAVNACNLDGGSSTGMYYNGEIINKPCGPLGISGGRYLPTAFLVMP